MKHAAAAIAATLLLQGCLTTQTAPAVVKQAVPEQPCNANIGPAPVYPADSLKGDEDLFTLGTTLWADRKARKARELVLQTAVDGCTKPSAPAP